MLSEIPLSKVVDTMAEGVLVLDTACRVVLWNRALEKMTGWTADEMVGQACSKAICTPVPAADPQAGGSGAPECALLKHTEGQSTVSSARCALRRKDGSSLSVLKNGRVLLENGKPVAAVITFTDLRPLDDVRQAVAEPRARSAKFLPPGRVVGTSPGMQEVYERVALAADSKATVLLLGETGTGKGMLAEAIHAGSARSDRPFVKVNCSALAESLLESELFGHVRGAFTGATADKIGRFEAADHGTLFLDEIGDVSLPIQLKLLRVLQEHEFERVGESIPRRADVRVICATNRDLRERVQHGQFREDLYYRIRVFPIDLPPLRHRKTDIPLLVQAFVGHFSQRTGKAISGISDDGLLCLMDHCWPGNVRELENAVEHAFVTCQGGVIGLLDLPKEIRVAELREAHCRERWGHEPAMPPAAAGSPGTPTPAELLTMLEACGWNRSETARRLGVDRTTVWRWMKQWGIAPTAEA